MEILVNKVKYTICTHALHRMKKRGVSVEDVIEALANPVSTRLLDGETETRKGVLGSNNVLVVYGAVTLVIITVYFHTKEYYKSKARQKRNNYKRRVRGRTKPDRRNRH